MGIVLYTYLGYFRENEARLLYSISSRRLQSDTCGYPSDSDAAQRSQREADSAERIPEWTAEEYVVLKVC